MSIPPIIYVVDDDPLICLQVASLLGEHGAEVQCYLDGRSFLATEKFGAGLVLLDHQMPQLNGLQVLETISRRTHYLPCVMMSGEANIELAVQAMKLGAKDFLEKPFNVTDLIASITFAWRDANLQYVNNNGAAAAKIAELTVREREVLQALMSGYSNKDAAAAFRLSVRTIEMHRARMMKRLETTTLAEAVQLAILTGLKPLDERSLAA